MLRLKNHEHYQLKFRLMKSKFNNLSDLLELKLKALYDIESEIIKALPKMAKAANNSELRTAFEEHLEETEGQKERLEKVFELLDLKPQKTKVEAIRGLVEDANWLTKQGMPPEALDASLVAAAQYVEHYEMAGYGSAIAWAREMGNDEIADLLTESLTEEEQADKKLSDLAESTINEAAMLGEEMNGDSEEA